MSTEIQKADNLRDKIFALERYIVKNLPAVDLEWVHRFAPGVYIREMIVPKGVLVTGAIHKTEHVSIFLEGKMMVPDENRGSRVIEAPIVQIAQPGVKRVGVALERVRWITVHPTELKDVESCEEAFFTNDPAEVPDFISEASVFETTGPAMLQRSDSAMIARAIEDEK